MSNLDFRELKFVNNKQQDKALQSIIFSLTMCVNKSISWKYTTNYTKLEQVLAKGNFNKTIRAVDTTYQKYDDMNKVIDVIINQLGMHTAKEVIPKAYILTPLANLWYQSLKQLKEILDKQGISHANMDKMNFFDKSKELKQSLAKLDKHHG